MVSPLVSADLLMLSRPPAPTAAPDTIAARRISRARFHGAGDSRAWPAEAGTASSVVSAAHLDRSDDHNRIVRPADTHAVRDQQPSPERDLRDRQAQELDRSGRRLHLELVGQLADLRRRVAAVATKGLQERQLAFLGPAGHGLG